MVLTLKDLKEVYFKNIFSLGAIMSLSFWEKISFEKNFKLAAKTSFLRRLQFTTENDSDTL